MKSRVCIAVCCMALLAGCSDNKCDGIEMMGQCISKSDLENGGLSFDQPTDSECQTDSDCNVEHATSVSCVSSPITNTNYCIVSHCEDGYVVNDFGTECEDIKTPSDTPVEGRCQIDSDCVIEHASSVTCVKPYGSPSYCEVNTCEDGYIMDYFRLECYKPDGEDSDLPCHSDENCSGGEDSDLPCHTDDDCKTEGVADAFCHTDGGVIYCEIENCLPGYHYYMDEAKCEKDDVDNCGYHGNRCLGDGVESATCESDEESDYGASCVQKCAENYHLKRSEYGNYCEEDDEWRCGEEEQNCNELPNAWSAKCEKGRCIATECENETALVDGQCIDATTDECCGDSCEKCNHDEGLTCKEGSCTSICDESTQMYCSQVCVNILEDVHHCGNCGIECIIDGNENAKTMACVEGKCVIETCLDNMTPVDNVCTSCITFEDDALQQYALTYWDENGNGCITDEEADAVTEIPENAFKENSELKTLSGLEKLHNLKTIGKSAFEGCTSLKEINLPYVETIDTYAFYECTALEKAILPNLASIEFGGFMKSGLKTVEMPNLKHTSFGAFQETRLESIILPKLEYVGEFAFHSCHELKTADFPSANKLDRNIFNGCSKLTEVSLTSAETIQHCFRDICNQSFSSSPWDNDDFTDGVFFTPENVTLTLNSNKSSEVTNDNEWMGASWKEIKYKSE